jgi:phosphoribosylformylglycinamidine synthase
LNFGNPTYPHVYWQFEGAVKGIADAADAMGTPVISGNVSFYNESDAGEVLPTPLIGMLGVLEDAKHSVSTAPSQPADLYLLSVPDVTVEQEGLGASSFLSAVHGIEDGFPEAPNVEGERKLCHALARAAEQGLILSAHDCSDGGLAVTLAEIALLGPCGVVASIPVKGYVQGALFGEIPGRVVVSTGRPQELLVLAQESGLVLEPLGSTVEQTGLELSLGAHHALYWSDDELRLSHEDMIEAIMEGD